MTDLLELHPGKERPYIPLELARSRIEELTTDLTAMKERHMVAIKQLTSSYENLANENRDVFQRKLDLAKNRAKEAISSHKMVIEKLIADKKKLAEERKLLRAEFVKRGSDIALLQEEKKKTMAATEAAEAELASLKTHSVAAKEKEQELKSIIAENTTKMAALESELEARQAESLSLGQQLVASQEEVKVLRQKLADKGVVSLEDTSISNTTNPYLDDGRASLQAEKMRLVKEIAQKESEVESAKKHLADEEARLKKKAEDFKRQKLEFSEKDTERDALAKKFHLDKRSATEGKAHKLAKADYEKIKTMCELQVSNLALRTEIQEAATFHSDKKKERTKLVEEKKVLEEKQSSSKDDKAKLESLKAQIAKLVDELAANMKVHNEKKAIFQQKEKERKEISAEFGFDAFKDEDGKTRKLKSEDRKELAKMCDLFSESQAMAKELKHIKETFDREKADVKALVRSVQEKQEYIKLLKSQLAEIDRKLDNAGLSSSSETALSVVPSPNGAHESAVAALAEVGALEQEKRVLSEQLLVMKDAKSRLTGEINAKDSEIAKLREEIQKLVNLGDDPEGRTKILQDQIERFSEETEAKVAEITKLRAHIEELEGLNAKEKIDTPYTDGDKAAHEQIKRLEVEILQLKAKSPGGEAGQAGSTAVSTEVNQKEILELQRQLQIAEERVQAKENEIVSMRKAMSSQEVPEMTNEDIRSMKEELASLKEHKVSRVWDVSMHERCSPSLIICYPFHGCKN